jgi:hypothetical protein
LDGVVGRRRGCFHTHPSHPSPRRHGELHGGFFLPAVLPLVPHLQKAAENGHQEYEAAAGLDAAEYATADHQLQNGPKNRPLSRLGRSVRAASGQAARETLEAKRLQS